MFNNFKNKLIEIKETLGTRQFFALLLVLVLLFTIPLTVYLVKQQQDIRSRASGGATVQMRLDPHSGTFNTGDIISVDLGISWVADPNSQGIRRVTGADVTINYASNLTFDSFTQDPQTTLSEQIISDSTPVNRTFHYVAVNKSGNIPQQDYVRLGTLKFRATGSGAATVGVNNAQVVALSQLEPAVVVGPSRGAGDYPDYSRFTISG